MVKSYQNVEQTPDNEMINRETQQVTIKNAYGEDFMVNCNDEASVAQVKKEIVKRTGVPEKDQLLVQNGELVSDYSSLQTDAPVELSYNLNGGKVSFEIEKKFPDFLSCNALCYMCDFKAPMPNWREEDFAIGECLCIKNTCGLDDIYKIQCFPALFELKPFKFVMDKENPIRMQCLCYKCGLQPVMDVMKEDFMTGKFFCFQKSCGLGETHDMKLLQCLPFKLLF